jgi:enterochelin esterase-like enzyme
MNWWREIIRGDVLTLFSHFGWGLSGLRKGGGYLQILLLAFIAFSLAGCSIGVPPMTETQTRIPPSSTATIRPATPTATVSDTPQPTRTLTPTPVCTDTNGILETESYPGLVLPEQIPYRIYLPPCYHLRESRYPVLYLLHGFPHDESQWVELGVIELVDHKIESKIWPPFLIVMPRQPEPLFTSSDGGPGSYEEEFLEGLIPHIDQTYRTLPSQDTRAIAGISRGGVWALEITFLHPDWIDVVVALSPALHVNYARPPYDPFVIVESGARLPGRIFLSAGEGEVSFLDKVEKLSLALDERGVAHSFVVGSGGHDAEGWKAMMEEALDFIVMGWDGELDSNP